MALERWTYTAPRRQYEPPGSHAVSSKRVAAVSIETLGESLGGAAVGADLGGSSKYSNENFED